MQILKTLACLGTALFMAASPVSAADGKPQRIIFAGFFGPDHPNTQMMSRFKEEIELASDGKFKVTLKPDSIAGGEEKIMALVKRGTIQVAQVGGLIKNDEPMIGGWEQPFVIKNWEHARAVFLSGGMKRFEGNYTARSGARIAGVIVNGFRQVSSRFPVRNMEEMAKMKIRVPLNEVFVKLFTAAGAKAVPLPATDLYEALARGTVDGQDNPYAMVKSMDWWKVNKYMLETRHVFSPTFILVNEKWYQSLDEKSRALFDESMTHAIAYNWDVSEREEANTVEFLRQNGVKITVPDAKLKAHMIEAAKPVWEWFDKAVPSARQIREYCASVDPVNAHNAAVATAAAASAADDASNGAAKDVTEPVKAAPESGKAANAK